jgi:hypothetical protein
MTQSEIETLRNEAAQYAHQALSPSNREWYRRVVVALDHFIEREGELLSALAGERKLRDDLAEALAKATGHTFHK